jgi:O-antigen ligase
MKLSAISINPKINKIWTIIDTVLIGCFSFTVPAFSDRAGLYHVLSLVSIALVISSLLLHLLFSKNFHFSFSVWCFIAFTVGVVISASLNSFRDLSTTIFSMILLFLTFTFYFSSSLADFRALLIALIGGGGCFAIYFFAVYHSEILSLDFSRIGSLFSNVNRVGDSFAISFAATIMLIFFFKPKKLFFKIALWAVAFVFLAFSAFTGSKAALLIDVVSLLAAVFVLLGSSKRIWFIVLVIATFFVLLGLSKIPGLDVVFSRFTDMFYFLLGDAREDPSSSERVSMFAQGFYYFGQRPLFGNGIGGFSNIGTYGVYSHNTISELLCDFGIFGFLTYEAPVIYTVIKMDKKDRQIFGIGLVLLVVIFFLQTSFPVFTYKMNSLVYGAFCGFIPRLSKTKASSSPTIKCRPGKVDTLWLEI